MVEPMLTQDNWAEYADREENDPAMLLGYLDATERMLAPLQKMLKTKQSYKELKEELLTFCKDRRKFVNHVDKHWNW